jgi:hypothetical protein
LVPKRLATLSTGIAVVVLIGMAAIAGVTYTVLSSQSMGSSTAGGSSTSSSSSVSTTSSSLDAETSTAGPGSATETANSSLDLELTLSVNSTTIPGEDAISITTSVLNTLPTANNLTASNGWAIDGLSSGPCDLGNSTNKLYYPVGVGVFKGTYGLNNLSSAGSPLSVWGLVECVSYVVLIGSQSYPLNSITSYSLLPGSDSGTYAGYYGVSGSLAKGAFATRIVDQETINATNGTGFYNSLQSSPPANYTLVVGDEWGQVALLHFSVVASNNLPRVGSFLSNGGGCSENNNPVPCTISEFSQAFIFNCAAQAATASGCIAQVPSSGPWGTSYTITVQYPDTGQPGEPAGDNCMFSVPGDTGLPYAYCFMVNASAFAMSP